MSHNLFWRDGPFSKQSLREYRDSDLAEATYTTLNFVDSAFCLITGLCGRRIFLDFHFDFLKLFLSFINWSLITWSYALNVSGFCSSRFKSDFRRPKLPDLFLFKRNLFSVQTKPVSCQPPSFLLSCCLNFLYKFSSWLKWFSSTPSTSKMDGQNHSLMFLYIVN